MLTEDVKNILVSYIEEHDANWVQTAQFVIDQCGDDLSVDEWKEVARIYKPYKKSR